MIDDYDDTAEAIFDQALSISDSRARLSFVEDACGDNQQLRRNVQSLLDALHRADDFFEHSPVAGVDTVYVPVQEGPGSTIGRYKLLERIGEGGFGVVYMAEQQEPFRRRVALKIIKLGMDTKQVIGRFEAERQALALMDHVNIAKVFDAGATETGRPYFVMELVKGTPVTEYSESARLTTRQRLELFAQVCDAVNHAHQKGIIHRDIKPSNVLVALHDDQPVPKVIDFGIAKATVHRLTERTVFTELRQLIGTPAYMSPEQATFNNLDIDTRSDVYSLGALLYELLTGTAPFDDRQLRRLAFDELCRVIREEVPPTPSQRVSTVARFEGVEKQRERDPHRPAPWLRGDIDWIVMKALEKDRQRRYESASSLATDIRRFLRGEPVSAIRPSTVYRLRKFVSRHRVLAASIAAVSLALTIGGAAATIGLVRAEIFGARLQEQLVVNQKLLYQSDMNRAMQAWYDGRIEVVEELLRRHAYDPLTGQDFRGFEWYYLWKQVQDLKNVVSLPHKQPALNLVFLHDGNRVVTAEGNTLKVWDLNSSSATTLSGHTDRILTIDRAQNQNLIASGGVDGTIRLWDLDTGNQRLIYRPVTAQGRHPPAVLQLKFATDASRLASSFDSANQVDFWSVETGEALEPLIFDDAPRINSLYLSHDGSLLAATCGEQARAVFCDLSKTHTFALDNLGDGTYAMAISPQGILAVGMVDGTISFWNLHSRKRLGHIVGHSAPVQSLAFSRDGRWLASGGYDNLVRLWHVTSRRSAGLFRGHMDGVPDVQFSPDGKRVASLAGNGAVKIWDVDRANHQTLVRHDSAVAGIAFIDSGNTVLSLGMDGSIRLTDPHSHKLSRVEQLVHNETGHGSEEVYPGTTSPRGTMLAAGIGKGKLVLYDLVSRTETMRFQAHRAEIWWPALSPDNQTCVTASRDGSVRLWAVPSCQELKVLANVNAPFEGAAFSPDGAFVAAANFASGVHVWDVRNDYSEFVARPPDYNGRMYRVVFSPDGKTLAACGEDSRIVLWDLSRGVAAGLNQGHRYLNGHTGRLLDLAFSPDSQLLASAGINSVLLWQAATGRLRATFRDHRREVTCLAFSPTGTMLVSGDAAGDVMVRKAATKSDVRESRW